MSGASFQILAASAASGGGGGISWTDSTSIAMTSQGSGWDGFTIRQVYSAAMLSTSGTVVRLQLSAGSFGGCLIDAIYIGEQASSGDVYDMKASSPAPTQFLVGGSGSFSIGTNSVLFTDALTFAIDETKSYVIGVHFNGTPDNILVASGTSVAAYSKAAASEAGTADVTGYSLRPAAQALLISKIQVA